MPFRKILTVSLLAAGPVFAQVEHKAQWQPVRTVTAEAPAPTHLAEREKEFAERNSPAALEQLAHETFGLLNPDYRSADPALAALYTGAFAKYDQHNYAGAIEGYRDFYLARMRANKQAGLDPSKRTFVEFFNEADLLMQNEILFAAFDAPLPNQVTLGGTDAILNYYNAGKHNAHMIDVRMQIGAPGRINWVYQPDFITGPTVHLPTDKSFLANAYNKDMFFTPLLAACVAKHDTKYLTKWAEIVDDFLLNHHRDMAEAGLTLRVDWGGAGGINVEHLLYVLNQVPGAEKAFPASTFVRLVQHEWVENLPLVIRGTRVGAPNRIMHIYGFQLLQYHQAFPELAVAADLIRERRRCVEAYARTCVNPDGTGIDYAPNYNKNYLIWPAIDLKIYETLQPPLPWLTPAWKTELAENQSRMARYLMRAFSPSGGVPGYKDPNRDERGEYYGPHAFLKNVLPELMKEPESLRLASVLTPPDRKAPKHAPPPPPRVPPSFNSEAYPYGGYYFLRENWNREAQFLYFNSYRPGDAGNWRQNQNIALEAFGQTMLQFYRWESALTVDGAGQIYASFGNAYPAKYRDDPTAVLYGTYSAHMAWDEPIKSRWLTSDRFDFAEGAVKMPYAEVFTDRSPQFIDDVRHSRQIIYVRQAGAWIVTDRIHGDTPHEYHLYWPLTPDQIFPAGWSPKNKREADSINPTGYAKDQIVIDPATDTIKTQNPHVPNLSIYHVARTELKLTPGDIKQNTDKFGNAYQVGPSFKTANDALVVSLFYPRPEGGTDLKQFTKAQTGFDAVTAAGAPVSYRAAQTPAALTAGTVTATASTLLVTGDRGLVLDCTEIAGQKPAHADFTFRLVAGQIVEDQPIYRPLDLVRIEPDTDMFTDNVEVRLEHDARDVDLRYTLDGTEPTLASPIYTGPFQLSATTCVKARAFRQGATEIPNTQDGTLASSLSYAVFTKIPVLPATATKGAPGLAFRYFEDDWTISALKLPILTPVTTGIATDLTDIRAVRSNQNSYAFIYEGQLNVPTTGVYTIYAPAEFVSTIANCGYDLCVYLDGQEWYPATRRHNYGNWCVALAGGSHALRVVYVDQRRGDRQAPKEGGLTAWSGVGPRLQISGPGLASQVIPALWLSH